ncbi:MAG TPA: hypothetical protein DCK98_01355 [Chloroflexi bacterium]|nr:hypothetical protein [Chloroflexota bacterium]HAL25801.1 hypothetical protein [Chloroflexota bacterium]
MTVTTRRERRERELRRKQREKRGGHPSRGSGGGGRGILIGAGIVLVLIVAILGLRQAGVLSLGAAVPAASPLPTPSPVAADDPARGTHDNDYSNAHVTAGTPVQYADLPPTSGSHWPSPAAPVKAGVYTQHIPFEATVHNLEHGGIVIVYNNLSADEVTRLNDFVQSSTAGTYKKVLDEPYPDLTRAKIVITAWRYHLDLQTVDISSMQRFIQAHYDSTEAPEPGTAW